MTDSISSGSEKPSFAQFITDPELLKALNELNFSSPTAVQEQSIPPAVAGKDVIIQAKTGSGKTLAYAIPLIARSRNFSHRDHAPRVIVLVPTRELANQVRDVISKVTALLPEGRYETPCIIGGSDMDAQIEKLERDCRIVVATPGRMLDLMRQKKLKLHSCEIFVLDEADEMLSTGFLEDIRIILSKMPDERQGMFVSATITPRVEMLVNSFLDKPVHAVVDTPGEEMPPVDHLYADVGGDLMAKPNALCDIMETYRPGSAIVFCNTKSDTQLVEALLRRRGFEARRLNSDLSQRQRDRVMKKIHSKELPILVATDIAARGLDIEALDMVVNYAIHEQPEIYVHRTGRTGRAGRSGIAISLVGPRDFGAFHFIRKVVSTEFKKIELPTDEEIAQARLAHVNQMLRESKLQITDRDRLIAKKLILENSSLTEPTDEFIEVVAKLSRHMVEHHLNAETKALDEEVPAEGSDETRHTDRSERRTDERREERPRDNKRERDREGRSNRRERTERRTDRNDQRQDQNSPVPLRIFISRGLKHGLEQSSLQSLVLEKANVPPEELRAVILRDNYSFLEVNVETAERLVRSLNGKDLNGTPLVVEPAIELQGPKKRHRRH